MPTDLNLHVTRSIRAELARHGKTQGDLAEALGMHPMTISKRMTGRQGGWKVNEVRAAADYLGVPISVLLEGE